MRQVILLRIIAGLICLFGLLHTLGAPWAPTKGLAEQAVVTAMQDVHFDVTGTTRSFWEFYQGFGYAVPIFMILAGLLLALLAQDAKREAADLRLKIALYLAAFLVNDYVLWRYLFLVPVIFSAVITALLAAALLQNRFPAQAEADTDREK